MVLHLLKILIHLQQVGHLAPFQSGGHFLKLVQMQIYYTQQAQDLLTLVTLIVLVLAQILKEHLVVYVLAH